MNEQIPQPQSRKKIDPTGQISHSMRDRSADSSQTHDYLEQAELVEFDSFFNRLQRMAVAWLNHSSGLTVSYPVEQLIYTLESDQSLELFHQEHPNTQPSEWLLGELIQMTFRLQDKTLDQAKAQKIRQDLTRILNTYDTFVYEQRNQSHIDWQRVDKEPQLAPETLSVKNSEPKWIKTIKNLLNRRPPQ
ncbi:MAG: hypothetical protein V4629_11610 [Pseudomonadota bacterium]